MKMNHLFALTALLAAAAPAAAVEKEHLAIRSVAQIAGHPTHPMLVVFPLGLLITSLVFDFIYLVRKDAVWQTVAFYLIWGGVIGGIVAAVPGLIDYFAAIPRGLDVREDATIHLILNASALVLFIINLAIRRKSRAPGRIARTLSVLGVLVLIVGGWFGGELVFEHGVGVSPAHEHEVIGGYERPADQHAAP